MKIAIAASVLSLGLTLGLSSVSFAEPTTAGERAGAKLDDAADATADGAKSAAHKTKRAAHKAKNKTGAAVEKAGDKMQD